MNRLHMLLTQSVAGILLHCIASILIRWCVALGPYSGKNKPPLFGDYEAQRHWQEVTFNLPVEKWYRNSSVNNLQYWGLDYPPLTAYHSWLCAYIASLLNPQWIALKASQGIEGYFHQLFMRSTVLAADLVVLFPALMALRYIELPKTRMTVQPMILLSLFYPGLILIDHGHFQYNNVSLGLLVWCVVAFTCHRDILGAFFFCLSLNYKQMELYHALPIFFYLLGTAYKESWLKGIWKIFTLGITVLAVFGLLWLPWLTSIKNALAVVQRLFPFGRGLFEDKVANVWCSISPVFKLKLYMTQPSLVKLCGITTLALSLPSCIRLFCYPTIRCLKLSLLNVSLVFFLFSYQVHEKSILIPAISACLLYDEVAPVLITWFLHMTVFSMSPLLLKDGLILQTLSASTIFLVLSWFYRGFSIKNVSSLTRSLGFHQGRIKTFADNALWIMFVSSTLISYALIIAMATIRPPARYPDIFPVIISTLSCAFFCFFCIMFQILQFRNTVLTNTKKSN